MACQLALTTAVNSWSTEAANSRIAARAVRAPPASQPSRPSRPWPPRRWSPGSCLTCSMDCCCCPLSEGGNCAAASAAAQLAGAQLFAAAARGAAAPCYAPTPPRAALRLWPRTRVQVDLWRRAGFAWTGAPQPRAAAAAERAVAARVICGCPAAANAASWIHRPLV